MASTINILVERGLISPPKFLIDNTHYEIITGSAAYGVNKDDSDLDVMGFCIPPKNIIFPHIQGVIPGFDLNYQKFDQWQQHHILDSFSGKQYDINIYNIVRFFRLAANCTPNHIDALFVPINCILHMSRIGNIVRENRKVFLCKKIYHSYKGYAYQQLSKAKRDDRKSNSKRQKDIEEFGVDLKFLYHVIRLVSQAEQMLLEGDLDLLANRKQLMSIRNGEWTLEQIDKYFHEKERGLDELYRTSKAIPDKIQEETIKKLLLHVLEEHYGSLSECVNILNKDSLIVSQIRKILDNN